MPLLGKVRSRKGKELSYVDEANVRLEESVDLTVAGMTILTGEQCSIPLHVGASHSSRDRWDSETVVGVNNVLLGGDSEKHRSKIIVAIGLHLRFSVRW